MFLSNVLMIGLFCSNNRMVISSEKFLSQQTCKGPCIYVAHMERGCPHREGLKIGHMSVCRFFCFYTKDLLFIFADERGGVQDVGDHKIAHLL